MFSMPRLSFSMAKSEQWTPLVGLRSIGLFLLKKSAFVAGAWIILYYCTQWLVVGPAMLLAFIVGAAAGLCVGWYIAQDAVDAAGFSGLLLWLMLVAASWLPIALVEFLLGELMYHAAGWKLNFGRWMMIAAALLLSMVSAVWRASADD